MMPSNNESNKQRIAEMRQEIDTKKLVIGEMMPDAAEAQMLELLRVDTLMRSMSLMESGVEGQEFDKALEAFLGAYQGSFPLIYGRDEAKGTEKAVLDIKNNIKIVSIPDVNMVAQAMPETMPQIEAMKELLANIGAYEKELAGSSLVKSARSVEEKDEEAEAVLSKMVERSKKKEKNAKIVQFVYGEEFIAMKMVVKAGQVASLINPSLFAPLNTPEGIERLNNLLVSQNQKAVKKSAVKADNAQIIENRKLIEKKIATEKGKFLNLETVLSEKIKKHLQKLSAKELLGVLAPRNHQDEALHDVLATCGNVSELKKTLANSLAKDKKIWDYVSSKKYYEMIKERVRQGYDKDALVYAAMPEPLKDLFKVRGLEIYALKEPDKEYMVEMNETMRDFGYRINLQKMMVSSEGKPKEYLGKSSLAVAKMLVEKAAKAGKGGELAPYKRRLMTLGLLYSLGEGASKNDDGELFKKYMQICFEKENFSAVEAITLRKKYEWDEFKTTNAKLAKGIYKEIFENAEDANSLKENLNEGIWPGEGRMHHIVARKYGIFFKNPDDLNNQPNIAITAKWNEWQFDKHQLEHFFSMTSNDGVMPYLTKENDEFVRKGDAADIKNEVYYEKPQVQQNGKWQDLMPEDTLLITPNATFAAPEIPAKVRHLMAECFKPISGVEKTLDSPVVVKTKKTLEHV